jgi:hypothetical protein
MITDVTKIPEKILVRMFIPPVASQPPHQRMLTEEQINKLQTPQEKALALMANELEAQNEHLMTQLVIHVNANRLVEARAIERFDKLSKLALIIISAIVAAIALKYIHP